MNNSTNPTVAIIDLDSIKSNLKEVKAKIGKSVNIMAVIKANAYGHGIVEVAKSIEKKYSDYLAVANTDEGKLLRKNGIKSPILSFLLPTKEQCADCVNFNIEPTVCNEQEINWLNAFGQKNKKTISVHLKIDTGMNRIGIKPEKLQKLLIFIARKNRINIKSVFTHFATSEETDKSYFKWQLINFENALEILNQNKVEPHFIHCANSGAILQSPESYFNMVRPGLILYGVYPSKSIEQNISLQPAMTLKTKISYVKTINAGDSVSYGRRYIAQRTTQIATLPIGYADGYFRLLMGKSYVLINGRRFTVIGICMDQIIVDVGNSDFNIGDEAILIGRQNNEQVTAWELSERIGTIPYEIFCAISSRVPRIYK